MECGRKSYHESPFGKVAEEMIAREGAATVEQRLNFTMSEADTLISLALIYTRS